jgi:hypothetical protein
LSTQVLKDARGRVLKIGSRVRGNFQNYDLEVHGHIVRIYETEKYGTVLAIEEREGNIQNLPATQCRRMYGNTKIETAIKTIAKKKAAKKAVRRKQL